MTKQEAFAASMEGPFDVGYAYTSVFSAVHGLAEIVVASDMMNDSCAVNYHHSGWHFGLLSPFENFNWRPAKSKVMIAAALTGYHKKEDPL